MFNEHLVIRCYEYVTGCETRSKHHNYNSAHHAGIGSVVDSWASVISSSLLAARDDVVNPEEEDGSLDGSFVHLKKVFLNYRYTQTKEITDSF